MVRVNRDVVFDESTSWYEHDSTPSGPTEKELDVNTSDDIQPSPLPKDDPSSIEESDSDVSAPALDNEFAVPIMWIPEVKK